MDIQTFVQQYERDGVVRVPQLFGPGEIQRIRTQIDRYIRETVPGIDTADYVLEADGKSVRNLWRLQEHDAFFAALASEPRVVDLVRPLVKSEPVLMGVETFNKPARAGSAVPAHQDNAYFCMAPPDVLTLWLALDPVTEGNGPIFYLTGSHHEGMRPHKSSGVQGNSMGLVDPLEAHDPFVGTLDPGDALIHHAEIVQYSAPNTTDHARCAMLMVFRGEHCAPDPELREAYALAR